MGKIHKQNMHKEASDYVICKNNSQGLTWQ